MNNMVPFEARVIAKALHNLPFTWKLYIEGSYAKKSNDAYSDLDLGLVLHESNFLEKWQYITSVLERRQKHYFVLPIEPSKEFPTFALCFLLNIDNPFHLIDISIRASTVGWRGKKIMVAEGHGVLGVPKLQTTKHPLTKRQLRSISALVMLLKLQKLVLRQESNKKIHLSAKRMVAAYVSPLSKAPEVKKLHQLCDQHRWEQVTRMTVRIWKRTEPKILRPRWKSARRALLRVLPVS